MKILIVLFGFLGLAASQPQPNRPNATNTTNVCNPAIQECANVECPEIGSPGRLLVNQPGRNKYAYVGIPINITWSFTSETNNNTFPVSGYSFYYRKKGEDDTKWEFIGNASRGNETVYTWNPKNALMKDTRYEMLILVDNVKSPGTGDNGPGNRPSCPVNGFPAGYPEEFVALNPPSGPADPNNPDQCTKYCPSSSASSIFSLNQFMIYLELLGGLFLVYAF